ncbi:anti-sigma factor family protein [Kitasatospora phosalacinea]|uniref:anti-sigma factor family protein n=1 Tax=Kitasatospora phosalacinea TaxID=2065 RepID=UPI0006912935|nr:zf-HC2 domain-containing protein [Kitasatospora phosalacinea]
MTPHPPSGHPDLDALADLAEDLLPPEQAAPLHAHLTTCPACAGDFAALRGLPELLADAPAPAMPQDVADRLAAALAAESAARAETGPTAAPPAPGPTRAPAPAPAVPRRTGAPAGAPSSGTGPGRPPRRRGGRLLLATAAVALVALAGGLGGSLLDRDSDGAAGSAAAGPAPDTVAADGSRGAKSTGGDSSAPRQVAPGGGADDGGPDFTAAQLPAQAGQLIRRGSPQQIGPASPDGAAAVPSCVLDAAGHPGEQPAATGPGRYQGRPVLALVFRPPGGDGPLDVYLATPDCPGSTILLHSAVPAP